VGYGEKTMTDWTTQPMGECPNTPEDPVSDEVYEAWIAAMDKLIAEAPPAAQDSAPGAAQAQDDGPCPNSTRGIQGRRRA
jgi:hypothetical protein